MIRFAFVFVAALCVLSDIIIVLLGPSDIIVHLNAQSVYKQHDAEERREMFKYVN